MNNTQSETQEIDKRHTDHTVPVVLNEVFETLRLMFMHDHMSGRQRHFDVKNLKKSNTCRQRETRETDKTVVAVEITVQNQEVGVDCIEGALWASTGMTDYTRGSQ
jgi:hypothetical protein